ncbi:MAG: hypothetical protein HUJ76_11205 [Parasporobacterium sp.]|nr:hypothetical protein [Parasporobacterium sp.]
MDKKQSTRRKLTIAILLAVGFMVLEFPGILIVGDRTEPFILGMPFLYAYIFSGWIYMCLVMFYAFRTSWGRTSFFNVKDTNE